jgi:magnesium-transporting ATPase (P-type)
MGTEGVREKKLSLRDEDILCLVPFDSGRKRGSIVVRKPDGGVRVYTKGAPDMIFDSCTNVMNADGSISSFDD